MGNKVNPIGFRIGVCFGWDSRWCVRDQKQYALFLAEDLAVRDFVKKNLKSAEIGRVEIERAGDAVRVILHSARPGVVIGKKGQDIEALRQRIAKLVESSHVEVSVQEIKKPELCSAIVAQGIAEQLERRASFKKVAKISIDQSKVVLNQQRLTVENEVQSAYTKALNTDKMLQSIDPGFRDEFENLLRAVSENFQKKNISLIEFTDFNESYKNNILQINELQNQKMQAIETLNFTVGKTILNN